VVETLREGFGFKVDDSDEFKEDIKILNENDEPIIFGKIKGTNAGVKREHVNQVDSHRERAGLSSDSPAILIINSHIKNARNLEEKDKEVVRDQVRHADKLNVLVLRTLDLLRLLELFKNNKITKAMVSELIIKNGGWLKVENDSWKVIKG